MIGLMLAVSVIFLVVLYVRDAYELYALVVLRVCVCILCCGDV